MRILLIILLLFSSLAHADVINPFRLLSLSSPEPHSSGGDLPVDSDCLLRPQFHGALPSVAYIQGAYFGYVNRCYWEAVSDVSTQSVNGASVVVIAWWSPRNKLPDHNITAGDTCRKKEAYPNVQFSNTWQDYDGYYANYDGCLYYSYCAKSKCDPPANYSGRFTPIGEPDIRHPDSKMTAGAPDDDFPLVSGYRQPWPEDISAGQMINGATLLEYYAYVYNDYCDYYLSRPETSAGAVCRYFDPDPGNNPAARMPLKKLSRKIAGRYECYAHTLVFPDMGDDVCTTRTAEEDEINGKIDLSLYYGHESYLSGIRQESDLNRIYMSSSNNGALLDDLVHLNHEMLAELKKVRKTTDQTQKDVKKIGTGGGSGGGTTGGNYHGDIQKINDDMNANHNALMKKLSENGDAEEGEGNGGKDGLKEQYALGMEAYGKGTLDEVESVLGSMFDNLPDFTLTFELPAGFYGHSGRPVGSCIPLSRHYTLDFTHNMKFDFDFDTTTACDYYDDYFRNIAEFGLYFLTALACFRMYHRNVGKE